MASDPAASLPRPSSHRDEMGGVPILVGRLVFGVLSVLLFLAWMTFDAIGTPFGPGFAAFSAFFLWGVHLFLIRKRVSPFDPVVWVPVSMLMFYFGLPVAVEVFDFERGYDAWQIGLPPNLDRGYCMLLFAFTAFLWGVHLAGLKDLSRPLPVQERDQSLAMPGVLLTVGALSMITFGIILVGPSVVFGYYEDWWAAKQAGQADPRFIDAGIAFTLGGIFALLASDDPRQRWRRWLAYAAAAFIAFVTISKGDRSGLIALLVGSGWCYSQRIRRVPPALVGALAAGAILLMPILVEYRDWKSVETTTQISVKELASEAFAGMGSSAMAVVFTEHLVPAKRDYAFGVMLLDAVIQLVPNFGLTPGRRWTFVDYYEDAPSLWLVQQINPEWAARGGGYGFAMAAEWYWDFGPPGVWIGLTFLGWFMARVRNASSRSGLMLAWSALLFVGMNAYVRNSIGMPLKFATWPAFGLWALLHLTRALGVSRARVTPGGAAASHADRIAS